MLEFIKNFTDKSIGAYIQIDDKFFLTDKNYDLTPKHIGVFLGENKDKQFIPSIELIELLSHISNKKVFVTDKAEWKFLNKKDILGKAITKANVYTGFVLVQNKNDENLGYGKFILDIKRKEEVVVKNLLDRGEYLRCESR
tara:strand:+ start:554 stop:976 length:423 start_codon:yes stop_codon:yes gene_type:complete